MKHNWSYSTIGVELKTSSGGTPNKMHKEFYEGGNIPWLRSGEVCKKNITETEMFITQKGMDNSSAKWFPENTVLVAMYGATAGQVGILRFPSTTNQAICGIFPNDKFLPEFLYYTLLYSKDTLVSQAVGNAQPNISQIKVKEVPLPKISIEEQQKIVEILDKEFEKIDTLKANAEKGLQYAKNLFQSALKQELQPKEGWITDKLNTFAKYSIGLTYKPIDISDTGTIVLRSSNIQNNAIELSDIVRVECKIKEDLFVQNGDILMCSRNGSARLVGKVAKIKDCQEQMTFGTFMTIIRGEYNPLLFYFFLSDDFRKQISKGENTMINQITKYMLDEVVISLPNDKNDMYSIASRLDKLNEHCNTLQKNYEKTIALCDDMKQALLRKAFNGEL